MPDKISPEFEFVHLGGAGEQRAESGVGLLHKVYDNAATLWLARRGNPALNDGRNRLALGTTGLNVWNRHYLPHF